VVRGNGKWFGLAVVDGLADFLRGFHFAGVLPTSAGAMKRRPNKKEKI
jgi:hypothetical protein